MSEIIAPITRRTLLAAGFLGTTVALGLGGRTEAADLTTTEQANVRLIVGFCELWGAEPPDLDKILALMTDDCMFKVDNLPPTAGKVAVGALFKTYFAGGARYEMKILETFARGPVVVNARLDTTIRPEKTAAPGPIVGVFVLKDGKIQDWGEYPYKAG